MGIISLKIGYMYYHNYQKNRNSVFKRVDGFTYRLIGDQTVHFLHNNNQIPSQRNSKQNPELMNNDPDKWFGPIYFNKEDSKIMVPKLNPSLGSTFNMASPYAIRIIVVIVSAIIITAFYPF